MTPIQARLRKIALLQPTGVRVHLEKGRVLPQRALAMLKVRARIDREQERAILEALPEDPESLPFEEPGPGSITD